MKTAASTVCPKCNYVRTVADIAPPWQCPACGIAYLKYQGYIKRAKQVITPPRSGDIAPEWAFDGSVWSLIIANVFTLTVALYEDWNTVSLMMLYWGQSVIIGIANVFRMLALDRFSTENFTMNGQQVDPTTSTKRQVAAFFAIHYGFFHAGYLVFLLGFLFNDSDGETLLVPWFFACIAVFAVNHLWSYRYNRDLDQRGTPNIGTLMFTPYLRIVPMHLTIIFGGLFVNSGFGLLLFGTLKTLADAGMHLVEHAQLKKIRGKKSSALIP
ncbi:MAG: hypothetical protein HY356_05520 [Gammaproteobacteria bacterium]|nr:hypothetical protein [Gammaproteobacteria bacterium]